MADNMGNTSALIDSLNGNTMVSNIDMYPRSPIRATGTPKNSEYLLERTKSQLELAAQKGVLTSVKSSNVRYPANRIPATDREPAIL